VTTHEQNPMAERIHFQAAKQRQCQSPRPSKALSYRSWRSLWRIKSQWNSAIQMPRMATAPSAMAAWSASLLEPMIHCMGPGCFLSQNEVFLQQICSGDPPRCSRSSTHLGLNHTGARYERLFGAWKEAKIAHPNATSPRGVCPILSGMTTPTRGRVSSS
jgi:hypothetical protein